VRVNDPGGSRSREPSVNRPVSFSFALLSPLVLNSRGMQPAARAVAPRLKQTSLRVEAAGFPNMFGTRGMGILSVVLDRDFETCYQVQCWGVTSSRIVSSSQPHVFPERGSGQRNGPTRPTSFVRVFERKPEMPKKHQDVRRVVVQARPTRLSASSPFCLRRSWPLNSLFMKTLVRAAVPQVLSPSEVA
jgi:hypothetical protein